MMYSHEDMDKAGFMRLNKVGRYFILHTRSCIFIYDETQLTLLPAHAVTEALQARKDVYGHSIRQNSQSVQSLGGTFFSWIYYIYLNDQLIDYPVVFITFFPSGENFLFVVAVQSNQMLTLSSFHRYFLN